MKTQFGFTQFTIQEFETYIKSKKVGRTILYIQEHHTFSPDYQLCASHTPFELQRGIGKILGNIFQHFLMILFYQVEAWKNLLHVLLGSIRTPFVLK